MDAKLSSFPPISVLSATDVIPVVSGGVNKTLTLGTLFSNMLGIGNKGITKNTVTPVLTINIPLTLTVCAVGASLVPYIIATGLDGQEITIVSTGVASVSTGYYNISMVSGSTVTLLYVATQTKWFVKSQFSCTIT